MHKPNIVYLHSHDTGRAISPYGFAADTPNLQAFADQAVVFRQAFTVSPTCSPSRAALLTGTYPHQNGMLGLAHRGFLLHDYGWHLVRHLQAAGYTTALSGIMHEDNQDDRPYAGRIGYDEVLYPREGEDSQMYASSLAAVDNRACEFLRRPPQEPFFLSVGFFETHRVYPKGEHDPDHATVPDFLPDTAETREDMAAFGASVRQLDERIGRVLAALDDSGLRENTIVILTTDHGLALPRCKCNLTDRGMGVFLMMRGPGALSRPQVVHAPVTQLDVFPTLCELAGLPQPDRLEGTSLLPLLDGSRQELHQEIFGEVNTHAAAEPMRCVRTTRWKYIRREGDFDHPVLTNCDGSPVRRLYEDHGWRGQVIPREQLYDLLFDPNEANNLAVSPGHQDVLADLRARLDAWQERTGDPVRNGAALPLPKGARLSPPGADTPADFFIVK